MKIKAGYGYWETDYYPIGGSFRRAPEGGLDIAEVLRTFPRYQGANTEGKTADGKTVAFDSAHTE